MSMTSMRSRSGRGMGCSSLAVAMKSTPLRLKGRLRKWSRKAWFCSGSSTSSSAELGSPLSELRPSLSISSSMITQLFVRHFLSACRMSPGIAPTYVRRWPRTSASVCTPPSETRWKSRPSAVAMLLPSEVLPMPGGPCMQRMEPLVSPLSLATARNSRIRSFTLVIPKWSSASCASAAASEMDASDERFHGRSAMVSRYSTRVEYSECIGLIRRSRFRSRCATSSASAGRPAAFSLRSSDGTSPSSSASALPPPAPGMKGSPPPGGKPGKEGER